MKAIVIAVAALAIGGTASAQDHHTTLGGSMGTQAAATPQSHSADMASGAHHTPVAKAARHHASKGKHRATASSSATSTGSANTSGGSGDMTPSGNSNPTQQH